MVPSRKQTTHKLPGTKGGLFGLKRVPRHQRGCLHKQRRRDEVGPSECPSVENPDLVCQKTGYSQSGHIPGWLNVLADKLSRLGQTIQTEWSFLPEVFQAICKRWHQPQIDLFATRFNNKLATTWAVNAFSLPWEDLDLCLPTSSHVGQSSEEVARLPVQENHSNCSRVAQHALVLGSGDYVQPLPTVPAQPAHSNIQSDSTQESVKTYIYMHGLI